jgi:hypothetical protein
MKWIGGHIEQLLTLDESRTEETEMIGLKKIVVTCNILSRVGWYAWRKWRVLVRTILIISTLVTSSFNYNQYSDIAVLHTFQFTVAHAVGFPVFTSRLLATDLNTETSTSQHCEVL